jgi:heavy metal translocating P-type ATPase
MSQTATQPASNADTSNASTITCRCTYCGLPVNADTGSTRAASSADGQTPPGSGESIYCCYGCRLAHAIVQEQGVVGAIRWTVIRLGLAIFFTMNLMAFTMTMWSLDVYDVEPDPFQQTLYQVFRWLSMLFALPVLILLGFPLLQNAFDSWRRRIYSTDLLIGLAVIAAYLTSVVNVVREVGTIYFEVGAMVLVMITLGRWIEAAGRQKATQTLDKLLALLPETVTRLRSADDPRSEESVPGTELSIGDLIRIRAGERFPTDAVIVRGSTSIDEQVFTGESIPVSRSVGDPVLAGTINLDGDLVVQASSLFRQGSFGRLMAILQQARNAKGHYQRLADKVASWFFPAVTLVATAAFAWHLSAGVGAAIQTALAVLLIACPCALGLATPLAVWTALSTAVRHQVLFRSGEAIERLAGTKAVCLDKTGTLTTGQPRVCQTAVFGDAAAESSLQLATQLAQSSSHPFSKAVAEFVGSRDLPSANNPRTLTSMKTVSGGGVEAWDDQGCMIRLGSVEFACCETHQDCTSTDKASPELCVSCQAAVPLGVRIQLDRLRMSADQQAASIVLLSLNRKPVTGFLITESVRPEARTALQQLASESHQLFVLSGDRPAKGRFLEKHLRVPGLKIECSLTPEQKVLRVADIRRKHGTAVMVGDGINDAPALAASDIGIAMGCGADVSRDSAQVCLLSNDLTQVAWAIRLARRTRSVIRQNLFWAFGYNTAGIALAATGILNPAIAAGLMIASSLVVISNSLRLLSDHERSTDSHSDDPQPPQSASPVLPTSGSKVTDADATVSSDGQRQSSAPGTDSAPGTEPESEAQSPAALCTSLDSQHPSLVLHDSQKLEVS